MTVGSPDEPGAHISAAPVEPIAGSGIWLRRDGGTAEVTITRPAHRNTLDSRALAGLTEILLRVEADPAVHGMVLRSGLPDVFCSGGSYVDDGRPDRPSPRYAHELTACFDAWVHRGFPVISVVDGPARAFGCALALTSEITIATRAASFGLPELSGRVVPSFAIALLRTRHSARTVGELALTTTPCSAAQADHRGLITLLARDRAAAEHETGTLLRLWATAGAAATRKLMQTVRQIDTAPDLGAVRAIAHAGVEEQLDRFRAGVVDQSYLHRPPVA